LALTVQGDFDKITNVEWAELCFKVLAMKILAKIMLEDCYEA
jgi:hypothetical protein